MALLGSQESCWGTGVGWGQGSERPPLHQPQHSKISALQQSSQLAMGMGKAGYRNHLYVAWK